MVWRGRWYIILNLWLALIEGRLSRRGWLRVLKKALGLLAPSASVDGLSREVSAQKIYSLDFIDKLIISYNSNIKLLFI
jgi:hypothetical protein